jgi:phosphoglycerol transferase MdoB-like AlkP superfamily enzyme
MRPLTVLIGIVMGSSVAIALGLAMVLIVFLILSGDRPQLRNEFRPLLTAVALFTVLSGLALTAFLGTVRQRPWRRLALAMLVGGLLLVGWFYWPRPS